MFCLIGAPLQNSITNDPIGSETLDRLSDDAETHCVFREARRTATLVFCFAIPGFWML
jgi:hypothetical protein